MPPDLTLEQAAATAAGAVRLVCGVDEAGRGPWAGPVMAAAVILDPGRVPGGLDDSKKLSEAARLRLADAIRRDALAFAVAQADVAEIDRLNILAATHLAMQRAVAGLAPAADLALVDGNRAPALRIPVHTVIGGDALSASIAAASILAKTARDARMLELDSLYPGYGFAAHKGYGTPAHAAALARLHPCPEHRHSFRPVMRVLEQHEPSSAWQPRPASRRSRGAGL